MYNALQIHYFFNKFRNLYSHLLSNENFFNQALKIINQTLDFQNQIVNQYWFAKLLYRLISFDYRFFVLLICVKTRKMKNILYPFLVMVIVSTKLFANPPIKGEIKGKVTDQINNHPIEYANIVLFNASDSSMITGTISSEDGLFNLSPIEKGSYYLKIDFLGYEAHYTTPILVESKKQVLDIGIVTLKPTSINLKEAEVVSSTDYISFKVDKKVVNVSEQTNAEGGAVVDALVNVPSVQVDALGNVSLRGSSSFTLLIDGRPSVLDASDALNQIQAASVEKIEIITNPSAKYNAEGTSGIVNLIMKKQKKEGVNGLVNLSLATGNKYTANMNLSKRTNKWTSNLGASYSNKRKRTDSKDERKSLNGDRIFSQNYASDRDIYRKTYELFGGLVFDANQKNSFSLNAKIGQWEFDRNIESKLKASNQIDTTRFFNDEESFLINNKYFSGDMGYHHKFEQDGHQLDLSFYYSGLNNETPNEIAETEVNEWGAPLENTQQYFDIQSTANRNNYQFNADYRLPMGDKWVLESGFLNETNTSQTDYLYQSRTDENNPWETNLDYSGEMKFQRMVNALYASLSTEVKGVQLKAGLRLEMSQRNLEQKTLQKQYDYQNTHLFPSLHVSKSLKNDQQISLSYSQRINRPNEWMLHPSPYSTGRNMLYIGNPELKADFSHSAELGYQLQKKNLLLSTGIYYRQTQNSITTSTTELNDTYYQTYENLDKEVAGGLEMMGQVNLKTWWKMNISANAYYYQLQGNLKSGYEVDDAGMGWNGSFRTTLILKKKTYLEFMAIYYGPSILPQGRSQDFYYFDFFLKRNFFNRKLTVALRSHNTFDTGIYIEDIEGPNFIAHTWFKYEGPTFMMSITYKINKFKRKSSSNQPDMNFDSGLDH